MLDPNNESPNNVESAIDAGEALAGVSHRITMLEHPADTAIRVPVVIVDTPHGRNVMADAKIMEALDGRRPGPLRRTGTHELTEVQSLIEYVRRHADPAIALAYADVANFGVVVVLDEHPPGPDATAWRHHRASYNCPRSPEWIAWGALDGKPIKQDKFADFLESRLEDIASADGYPAGAEVLTLARNLTVRTAGVFTRDFNPTTGDSILINRSETTTGSTVIPRAFLLGIPVFEGGVPYRVEARIRFALSEGVPMFSFTLHRRKEIERDAFNEVRAQIATGTGVMVLAGSPGPSNR